MPLPYKVERPITDQDIKEITKLDNQELHKHLGPPIASYDIDGNTYLIYGYPAESGVFPLMHPVGYLWIGGMIIFLEILIDEPELDEPDTEEHSAKGIKKKWASACLMITLDNENIIKAEARSLSQKQSCEEVFRENLISLASKALLKGDHNAALLHAIWTDDRDLIRRFALEGYLEAAIVLAENSGDTGPLKKIASSENGNPELQMRIYLQFPDNDRLYWLCQAADNGYFQAQIEVGNLYWRGLLGIEKDLRRAYVWYSLAAETGSDDWDVWELHSVKKEMTPHQLAESELMLANWQSGQCERDLFQANTSGN